MNVFVGQDERTEALLAEIVWKMNTYRSLTHYDNERPGVPATIGKKV